MILLNSSKLIIALTIFFVFSIASGLKIEDVYLLKDKIFPGDVVEGIVEIKSNYLTQYFFEYTFNNEVYKKGDTGIIYPNETAKEKFFIEVPNESLIKVKFKVYNGTHKDEFTKIFLISKKYKSFLLKLNQSEFFVEDKNFSFKITVINVGNQKDWYKINVKGWEDFEIREKLLLIEAGNISDSEIKFTIPKDLRVGEYKSIVEVCNSEGKCKQKSIFFTVIRPEIEQTEIFWNDSKNEIVYSRPLNITYQLIVKNIGKEDKNYNLKINLSEGLNSSIEELQFTLKVDEIKEINFTLIPTIEKDHYAKIKIFVNGEEIFYKNITLKYKPVFAGFFLYEAKEIYYPGLIFLSIIGAFSLIYFIYSKIKKRIWIRGILEYTRKHPKDLTRRSTFS